MRATHDDRKRTYAGTRLQQARGTRTIVEYFRAEFVTHIERKYCPATVCRDLFKYRVVAEKCTGCGLCVKVCPTGALSGPRKEPHHLDDSKCIKCRACYEICNLDAIAGDSIIAVPAR